MTYYDLGAYLRPVTTISDVAQTWFDRGLIWTYAYYHEAAIDCFRQALDADPDLAMAHWGIAYCIGPNYNKPWEAFEEGEKPDCIAVAPEASRSHSSGPFARRSTCTRTALGKPTHPRSPTSRA